MSSIASGINAHEDGWRIQSHGVEYLCGSVGIQARGRFIQEEDPGGGADKRNADVGPFSLASCMSDRTQ